MKRNFTRQLAVAATTLSIFGLLSSCSTINDITERTMLDSKEKSASVGGTVPRAEYDALLKKYEALINEKQISGAKTSDTTTDLNKPAILDALANSSEPALAETVNVFDKDASQMSMPDKKGLSRVTPTVDVELNPEEIEREISMIRQSQEYIAQNKFNKAMENLKLLESSPVKQIRVNSKFLVGEILFKQKEYDLAMQIFEEIINNDAFSGVIIKALGRLIVCAEKLKLAEKQQRYHSLLHDFFET